MGEAVGAHAIDAAAEYGVLNGRIARHHHSLNTSGARIPRELLDHLIGGIARTREHNAYTSDFFKAAIGIFVVSPIEHDNRFEVAASVHHHIVNERFASAIERIGIVIGVRAGVAHVAITRTAAQHVIAIDEQ